eukprot:COSAG06_NODE_11048_length_1576_cov_1.615437_4_plen_20_part_01
MREKLPGVLPCRVGGPHASG